MIRTLSGAEIAITDKNDRVVAASRAGMTGAMLPLATAGSMESGGREYRIMSLPFADFMDRPLGRVVIMSEDTLPQVLHRANLTIIAVLVAISLGSILITAFLLRRVLAPIESLRIGAERIGRGHFEHRVAITSGDEIGSLAGGFNAMAANLEQMRAVEEKLKHAERLASIGEFTAATAHELNNPIANIIGLAKVVRKEVAADNGLGEDLELIAREAGRCGAIVRALLLYSRSSKPNRENTDLNQLIEEIIASLKPRYFAGREISINFQPLAEAKAFVDPVQIGQVLANLLINAAQAISDPGGIGIHLVDDAPEQLTIVIEDSGSGIPPEYLEKIFYPFFTTKKTGEGTGLGLAVCFTIVQSHGGTISAANRPAGGAVFTLTLPRGEEG